MALGDSGACHTIITELIDPEETKTYSSQALEQSHEKGVQYGAKKLFVPI